MGLDKAVVVRHQAASSSATARSGARAERRPGRAVPDRRAGQRQPRGDEDRRREAVGEGKRRDVAAGRGEDGDRDRDPEHSAQLAHHAVGACRLADRLHRHGADDRVLRRGDRHRHAHAGEDERREDLRVGHPGLGDQRQPRHAGRLQRQAAHHQRALADPVGQRAGHRRHRQERRRPRHQPQACLERAVPEPDLQQLGVEEDRAEQRPEHEEDRRVAGRERTGAEQSDRDHRLARAHLPGHERRRQQGAGDERRDHLDAPPSGLVAAHQAPDEAQRASGHQHEAGDVEAAYRARGSRASG